MAKKKEVVEDGSKSKLELAMEKLNKSYGKGTILAMDSKTSGDYDVISTGSIGFDYITLGVGGVVKGKMYEFMGWEGCLAEDTFIKFINVRPDGVVQDCKGGTIKNLYERFHNRTEKTKDTEFNVASINEEDRVFRNPIADVVQSGVNECFELVTSTGFRIKATKDHKFYVGDKYVALKDLKEEDIVFIHDNRPYKSNTFRNRSKYKETTIKWYYRGKRKEVGGFLYYRERVHRLIFEANMNNISYNEYIKLLNNVSSCLPANFWTIPEGYEVHHKDENTTNNDIDNLELLDSSAHARLHAIDKHNNLRFVVSVDEIVSIKSVGEMMTYDIKCFFPYNNFIANGIVVHNSGKSTICGHLVANCQAAGGVAVYIDGEHAVDKKYFQALGVDTTKMLIAQPASGEEGFQIAEDMIKSGQVDLIVIDSDSSLIPKAAIVDGDVGDSTIGKKARLNSNAYPRLKNSLVSNKTCVVVISQYREKIGMMFGNPTTTQGGHALKFYSDVRVEISKSLAKADDQAYGNITKIKATKNKMSPPYRASQFEIVYGKGIDKIKELLELAEEFEIIKKYGKTITLKETKYDLDDFKALLNDNPEFFDEIKQDIVDKILKTEIPIENVDVTEEVTL